MKKLILTTLNNNDEIWYRCFVPFILSLRKTDYDGDIGVISYHLSSEKREKLAEHNVLIFEAEYRFNELLIDRHISTALIAQNYDYEQIALYDADIWFSSPNLTIFEQVQDNYSLHCCYDVIKPTFLTSCIPDNKKNEVQEKFNQLYHNQQYIWQAGVLIAHKQGWINYLNYIEKTLGNLMDFSMVYGIDACVLNLYAYDTNQVTHISEKYNCLPYWGIKLNDIDNGGYFTLNNEMVEGVHVTRFHRMSKEYNYIFLYKNYYLQYGTAFSLNILDIHQYTHCGKIFSTLQQKSSHLLTVEYIECNALLSDIDTNGIIASKDSLFLNFTGNSTLTLRNNQQDFKIGFIYQALPNKEIPTQIKITLNNRELDLELNKFYLIEILSGDILQLSSCDIWKEKTGIRYVFHDVKFI